ncbi:GIY-YIG nuclease family protein [Paludibaculum fermentans]|uniref:GIY-YIG nuclease family protein n=1 Tax=Paludibaculum fermentans TaxID=1473598 RepID=A0A7S7NTW1_PALFE|nr:GIY-YIG nuclease family protein [Paludibaculum fermentans]QOY89733.1 GIY-YIG nuclease family protein [Paludibaculum fermentans]
MLSSAERKEINRKYKEQKPNMGIFAVRCAAGGLVWVGSTRNLDAAKNSHWFALGHGSHRDRALQEAWNGYGAEAFVYEVLEKLDEDLLPIAVADVLKEKRGLWVEQLGARVVLS